MSARSSSAALVGEVQSLAADLLVGIDVASLQPKRDTRRTESAAMTVRYSRADAACNMLRFR